MKVPMKVYETCIIEAKCTTSHKYSRTLMLAKE